MWSSIPEAARALGVSERTAWRWLKSGKIRRTKAEGGGTLFVASPDISTDNHSVTDVTCDNVSTSRFTKGKIPANRVEGPQPPVRREAGMVGQSLRDELEATRIAFELERLEHARFQWEERRDRERREKQEQERMVRLEGLRQFEKDQKSERMRQEARHKIQIAKKEACEGWDFLPPHIFAFVLCEIEQALSKLKVDEIPTQELIVIAEGVRDRVIQEPSIVDEVRKVISEKLRMAAIDLYRREIWRLYQASVNQGFEGSYEEWIMGIIDRFEPGDQEILKTLFLWR
jgi:hypothetical protein